MRLNLFLEHRFKRTPDGQVWSAFLPYDTWTRYLHVFSEIRLCARVTDVPAVDKDVAPATGEGVTFGGLPYYHGPQQYLLKRRQVQAAVSSLVGPGDAYIVRAPGNVANQAVAALRAAGVPYAIEVVGDPWDMFSPGSSTHPLRWFFRRLFTRAMRQQCANAAVSLFVTEHALQRRYPPKAGSQSFHSSNVFLSQPSRASTHAVSDVCLGKAAYADTPRNAESFANRPVRFVCVGSFNLLYKAQDVLVKAFARAVGQGLDGHLSFVGDGIYRPGIEALVLKHAHLRGRVEFLGQLRVGESVRQVLNTSHVFVLPSRQEGLPRAALEAMACGLPCIGSDVGGFPEILQPDAIVRPDDVKGLAECMVRLAASPARLVEMSAHNLRRAGDFQADKLAVRQSAYYTAVHDLFTDWWTQPGGSAKSKAMTSPPSPLNGLRAEPRRENSPSAAGVRDGQCNGLIQIPGPRNKKILHLITLSVIGGAQDNTFSTAKLHDRNRYDVHVACNPDGDWLDRARGSADSFHSIPTLVTPIKPLKDLRALLDLIQLFRRERFDLVHTHTAKAGFLGRIAACICRVPLVVHTYHAFPFHDFMPRWRRLLFLSLERMARPVTDFFITLSDRDREAADLLRIVRREDAEAVYTGISFDKLDGAAAPEVTRARLNIPPGWQVVMTAGRLEPAKAPHLLVEAFSEVVKRHPKTVLLLAGDGELRPLVEQKISSLGLKDHVRMLGFRSDVPDLLRIAEVFAFSSLWEAMGRALVEAMLLGRAVVAPAIFGIPEIVHHEETGLLYEVGRVDQLSANISRLLGKPEERERLGANARRLTRKLFDVNHMVTQIEEIYEELLSGKPMAPVVLSLPGEEQLEEAA